MEKLLEVGGDEMRNLKVESLRLSRNSKFKIRKRARFCEQVQRAAYHDGIARG